MPLGMAGLLLVWLVCGALVCGGTGGSLTDERRSRNVSAANTGDGTMFRLLVIVRETLQFHAGDTVPDSASRNFHGACFANAPIDAPLPTRDPNSFGAGASGC